MNGGVRPREKKRTREHGCRQVYGGRATATVSHGHEIVKTIFKTIWHVQSNGSVLIAHFFDSYYHEKALRSMCIYQRMMCIVVAFFFCLRRISLHFPCCVFSLSSISEDLIGYWIILPFKIERFNAAAVPRKKKKKKNGSKSEQKRKKIRVKTKTICVYTKRLDSGWAIVQPASHISINNPISIGAIAHTHTQQKN